MKKRFLAFLGVCVIIMASACTAGPAAAPAATQTSRFESTDYASAAITVTFTESATFSASFTPTFTPASSASPTRPTRTPLATATPISSLRAGQTITLTEIHMVDRSTGWAVESGGHAVYTADGGRTWRSASPYEIKAIYSFLDADHAWAFPIGLEPCAGEVRCEFDFQLMQQGVIWRTSDAGRTWTAGKPIDFGGFAPMLPVSLDFADRQAGWFLFIDYFGMSGSTMSALVGSQDSGQTWSYSASFSSPSRLTAMMFQDTVKGWIGRDSRYVSAIEPQPLDEFVDEGFPPSIEKTMDGGVTWTYAKIPPATILSDSLNYEPPPGWETPLGVKCGVERIQKIAAESFLLIQGCTQGYAVESDFRYGYLTPDGGATWHSWLASGNEYFTNATIGWRTLPSESGGLSQFQRSVDGGRNWTTIRLVAWENAVFDFVDEWNGWVVASIGEQHGLAHTSDGGETWIVLQPVVAP